MVPSRTGLGREAGFCIPSKRCFLHLGEEGQRRVENHWGVLSFLATQ